MKNTYKKKYKVFCAKTERNSPNDSFINLTGEGSNDFTLAESLEKAIEIEKVNLKHLKKSEGLDAIISDKYVQVYDELSSPKEVYSNFSAVLVADWDSRISFRGGELSKKETEAYIEQLKREHPDKEFKTFEFTVDCDFVEVSYNWESIPFERIRRITGYLVGTLDRFNNAKRAEVGDRVKHPIGSGKSEGEILKEIE